MRPVTLGILGAGLAVRMLHWPALRELDGQFEVVAVCDVDARAAAEVAGLVGGRPALSGNWEEFFNTPGMEAVLISLPIQLNAQAIRAAARAGKHILCEKPLAADWQQAGELVAELRDAPQVIAIAENYHYRQDLRQTRRWMDAGAIGAVVAISLQATFWSDTTRSFASTPWRHDQRYRGAVIADSGVHHAAALREVGGEVERLQAFIKDVHPVLAGPDSMVLNLRFRSGVLGQVLFSGAVKPGDPCFDRMLVIGTEGSISTEWGVARLHRAGAEPEEYVSPDRNGYLGEFRNF
ncbi:MAG TPA: Gfo/Idh/MocA family oxidoreductase, partial [Herpetosiphonaceae bacterium]|nr:Gfo/Idh/MocA family oxidoreductase [Herpetosiphonaceae bacterium]